MLDALKRYHCDGTNDDPPWGFVGYVGVNLVNLQPVLPSTCWRARRCTTKSGYHRIRQGQKSMPCTEQPFQMCLFRNINRFRTSLELCLAAIPDSSGVSVDQSWRFTINIWSSDPWDRRWALGTILRWKNHSKHSSRWCPRYLQYKCWWLSHPSEKMKVSWDNYSQCMEK